MKPIFTCLCIFLFFSAKSQTTETHNFITYDTTYKLGSVTYLIRISRPANMFKAGDADTASRPAIITMPGIGEMGTDASKLQTYGPHWWLNNGWDGGVVLGNGTHYPILITMICSYTQPYPEWNLAVLNYLLNTYHIKRNSVHLAGLSQGAFTWSAMITYESSAGAEDGMKPVTSLTLLSGAAAVFPGPGYPYFGHWAKKYKGKLFATVGYGDAQVINPPLVEKAMNDSVKGSAYFTYNNIGNGTHCCWNTDYDPNQRNWQSFAPMGPYIATGADTNSRGTYKTGSSIFQWMLRQGDTSIVGGGTSDNVTSNAGSNQTLAANTTSTTLNGGLSLGSILSYSWSQVSGPNTATITSPSAVSTTVTGLIAGTYVFALKLTSLLGAISISQVTVTVNAPINVAPVANAGADQVITLPTNSVTLAGSGTDQDGTIAKYAWAYVSGPTTYSFSNAAIANPVCSNLVAGTYVLRLTVTDNVGATATDDVSVVVNAAPAKAAAAIPGTIEAESYDGMSGIQTETTSDTGGGLDVGWIDNGDWMSYNVNVATAGTYTVNFRVATPNTGASLQLRKSDGTVLSTVSVDNTGGYQTWKTVTTTVSLAAGSQTLVIASNQAINWNFNWVQFTGPLVSQPSTGTVYAIPGMIEAESYTSNAGVLTQTVNDAGGGLNVGWIDAGDWMSYNVNAAAAGTYAVNLRVATPYTGAAFEIRSQDGTVLTKVNVDNTGGFQSWKTISAVVTLPAGVQTLTIASTAAINWNINWVSFTGPLTNTLVSGDKPVPGIVQAENYDAMSGVLAETTTDAGGGQDVGSIGQGDWMDYAVNAAIASNYIVTFRVAATATGGTLQLRKSDGTVLGSAVVPNTGGWQLWTSVSMTVPLPAGSQKLRVYSSGTAGVNVNWIQWAYAATPAAAVVAKAIPGTIQAESYDYVYGMQTESTMDTGGGQDVGWIGQGDWVTYNVTVTTAGTYTVNFRVATPNTGATFQLKNGDGTVLTTVNVDNTGSYQTWKTISATVTLPAGAQTLVIYSVNAPIWNINWMQFVSGTTTTQARAAAMSASSLSLDDSVVVNGVERLQVYPNPVQDVVRLDISNGHTGAMKVQIIDVTGRTMKVFGFEKEQQALQVSLSAGDLPRGNYFLRVQIGDWSVVRKLVKM